MKYLPHVFVLGLLLSGCDTASDPAATIIGIDVSVGSEDHFLEIQDVAGRTYAHVERFPASVDVQLWSSGRDYFVILIRPTDDGLQVVAASEAFKTGELTGTTFTTGGDVQAVLSLE